MAYKDILVHLDDSARSPERLNLAIWLAAASGAHLTGVHAINIPAASMFYGYSMTVASPGPEDLIETLRAEVLERIGPVEEAFRERIRQEGLDGEWRVVEGEPGAMLALHARYADLAIVGQPNRHEPQSDGSDAIPVSVLMSSGRPALVVPFAGRFAMIGEHVLVAWNASREAARALNDALPLLRTAQKVTVLAINPERGLAGHGDIPSADISLHLARHGVKAEAAHTVATDIADGPALLSYAADIGVDLIVAGAYGHSRMRELAFGGVTRTLLNEMTVPVLFSH
jgi:nucleotide-binding universal stress UspA family protein